MAKGRRGPIRQKPPIEPRRPDQYAIPDVSRDHQCLIGLFVLNWSKLEGGIEETIWELLHLDIDAGRRLTSRLNTDVKIEMLRSLILAFARGDLLNDMIERMDYINGYKEDRNFIVHGQWGTLMQKMSPSVPHCGHRPHPERLLAKPSPKIVCLPSSMAFSRKTLTFGR
jgi:hypothetical protein